jgi:Putative Ig domain
MIDDLKLQDGKVNNVYPEQRLQASGATGTVQWTVTQGGLPPGLSLGSDGRITGTPMKEGTFSFTVEAADSKTKAPRSLTIKINA